MHAKVRGLFSRIFTKKVVLLLAAVVLLGAAWAAYQHQAGQERVSEFGKYQGYTTQDYDGSRRTSDFLTLSDGTRLAYDLFLPTKKGAPAEARLPTLFKYTPYGRAWTVFDKNGHCLLCAMDPRMPWYSGLLLRLRGWVVQLTVPHANGQIKDALSRTEWLGPMVNSGYAVIVVDRPGTGASFGQYNGDPDVVAGEADQILNWIAAQPWSDGQIGMFGDSIQAQIQFRAASTGNPHLKAILPATTWMDNYSAILFAGGVRNQAFTDWYANANRIFDLMATPVDQDTDGALLAQARAERQNTSALSEGVADTPPYRDSLTADGQPLWLRYQTLYPLLDRINRAGVPVYLINGWYDIYARDNFLIYANLAVPKRLLVRPTDHAGIEAPSSDVDYGAEAHRWFDYWLKGIDNGIMAEPPIHYYLQGVGNAEAYQSAQAWPLDNQAVSRYYFAAGDGNSRMATHAGALALRAPADGPAFDAYTVDYTTTTGKTPHWTALAMPHQYPNMRSNDARALTYTTPPLAAAVDVIGHPVVHLWLSTPAPDLDAFVYLEEVDASGNSTYITQGNLRASHRALSAAPFANFGLPWHNHFQSELQPIPAGEPFELVFDLLPTAWHFPPGRQIRLSVAFADAGNFNTPVLDPAPKLAVLHDSEHGSYVDLPMRP
jgi:putative CocE/NonD family hydrolase